MRLLLLCMATAALAGCGRTDCSTTISTVRGTASQFDHPCSTDADCILSDATTRCVGMCQTAVLRTEADAYRSRLAELDAQLCSSSDCGLIPNCGLVKAVCENGTCATISQ